MITAILAQSKDMVIGTRGPDGPCLPWTLPPDLKRFRQLTTGHAVVMGRVTFESIGRALPNRRNIVVSSKPVSCADVEWAPTPTCALEMAIESDPHSFIIGGARIYSAFWDRVDRIELTKVDVIVGLGLVFGWDPAPFAEVAASPPEQHEGIGFRFMTYERTSPWVSPSRGGVRG